MPDYKVVGRFCSLRGKQTRCPAVLASNTGGSGHFSEHINDCFGKDAECANTGCVFAGGEKDPFAA